MMVVAFVLAIVPLGLVCYYVVAKGAAVIDKDRSPKWSPPLLASRSGVGS